MLWIGSACGREGTARPPAVPEAVKPAAVAGPDQIVPVGREVLLDGRGSTNPAENPDLSFRWSLLDQPYFSGAFLLEWDRAVTYFIPDLPGRYYLELKVSDGQSDSSDVAIITAKVLRSDNRAPELTQVIPAAGMISISPGQEVNFSVTAEDPDGDEMVFNWYVDDVFAASGSDFIFIARPEQVGSAVAVRVVVSDGDKSASQDWVMVINQADGGGNQPPAFIPAPDQAVSEGETLVFVVRAVDPDGDPVSYFASLLPTGAVFFKETGKFKWIPDYDQAGEYGVVFSASDGKAIASITVNIRVLNTNRAPTLEVTGNRTVSEGGELVLQLLGSDPDEDLLSFAYTPSLRGAVLYPRGSTAAWVWHPDYDQAGSYREVFTVTDLSDPPLTASVALDLVVYNTNRPPVLAGLLDQAVSEGQFLDFWLIASDPDGNNVTYTAGPMPRGSTLNVNTGEFFWMPDYDQAGDYILTVTATDDGYPQLSSAGTIMITVLNVNRPPAITAFSATPSSLNTGGTVNFSVTAHDPDGDTTIAGYDWDFKGDGTWDQHTLEGSVQVPNPSCDGYTLNGIYTARVRAVDDGGLTAEATTPVRVKPGVADLLLSQLMKSGTAMGIYLEVIPGSTPSGYLYLADGEAGMEVFSVPNLNNPDPILLARAGILGEANNIYKYGNQVYLSLHSSVGIKVFDVSNNSSPLDLETISSNEKVTDVYVQKHFSDQKIYVYNTLNPTWIIGLHIYDLENLPSLFTRVYYSGSSVRNFNALDVDEKANVFTASKYGMEIFNFQNPVSNLYDTFDLEVPIGFEATDVDSEIHSDGNHYVYLLSVDNKMVIYSYSVNDPVSSLTKVTTLSTYACSPERITITNSPDLAYISIGSCGYQIASLTDPVNPLMLIPSGRFDPCTAPGCSEHFYQIVNYGDFSFIGGGSWGLVVTKNNISGNPPATANPGLLTSYNTSGNPTDLQTKGNKLFLTLGRGGMDVYNLTLPESPKLIGNVDTAGLANGLSSDELNWAYVADRDSGGGANNNLRVVDITSVNDAVDPVKLTVKSSWPNLTDPYPSLNSVSRVFVSSNYAYLCADKLYLIDVTSKTAPIKVGEYPISSPRDVVVSGSYAYVVNQNTFEVLNISNPALPVRLNLNTIDIVNGQAVAYANGLVYVADGDSGLKIYDVSNPQNVVLRGTYAGKAYDVELLGDYVFVAADDSGMVMLDVSNPASPVLQVSQAIASKVVNRISVSYDAISHYYYVYTLNGTWINKTTGEITLDQLSVIGVR
jgi:hypothetical protein